MINNHDHFVRRRENSAETVAGLSTGHMCKQVHHLKYPARAVLVVYGKQFLWAAVHKRRINQGLPGPAGSGTEDKPSHPGKGLCGAVLTPQDRGYLPALQYAVNMRGLSSRSLLSFVVASECRDEDGLEPDTQAAGAPVKKSTPFNCSHLSPR